MVGTDAKAYTVDPGSANSSWSEDVCRGWGGSYSVRMPETAKPNRVNVTVPKKVHVVSIPFEFKDVPIR
jgi:hypothetical protein